jgi:malate dehydrogenase (oxaloacetate-decarboxylating)(NADP+)
MGRIYPPLQDIRKVSSAIAVAVAEVAYKRGLAQVERPDDLLTHVKSHMFNPVYENLA